MYKHMLPIMAIVRKWRGKICLAFLFRVSLDSIVLLHLYQILKPLVIFCGSTNLYLSDLVRIPKDSHHETHLMKLTLQIMYMITIIVIEKQ